MKRLDFQCSVALFVAISSWNTVCAMPDAPFRPNGHGRPLSAAATPLMPTKVVSSLASDQLFLLCSVLRVPKNSSGGAAKQGSLLSLNLEGHGTGESGAAITTDESRAEAAYISNTRSDGSIKIREKPATGH